MELGSNRDGTNAFFLVKCLWCFADIHKEKITRLNSTAKINAYDKKENRKEQRQPFFPGFETATTAAERLEKRKKVIVQFQMYKDYEINPSNTNREVEKTL